MVGLTANLAPENALASRVSDGYFEPPDVEVGARAGDDWS